MSNLDVRSSKGTAESGNSGRPAQADDLGAAAPTGHLWPIPVAGDYLEALVRPVDSEWILEKPGRRFGYSGLPAGHSGYERMRVLDVKPEDGTLTVTMRSGFTVLRYFAECRWPDDGPAADPVDSSSADEDEDRRWENEGGAALPDSSSDERTKPERFRSICVSINVRGVLEKSNAGLEEFFPGTLKRGGRAVVDGEEIRSALLSELQLGHERLPIGKPCSAWDWKTGCRGHEWAASSDAERSEDKAAEMGRL
jgi:hypothetical protein